MIEKIRIKGYRKFHDVVITPEPGLNVIVGDNESGKSTLVEAIGLALTGRINGRFAQEEISPYWFNRQMVEDYFNSREVNPTIGAPRISIELFFQDCDELQRLCGAVNSNVPTFSCPGVQLIVEPNPEYATEIEAHFATSSRVIPVDYYRVVWRSFADETLTTKPRELSVAVIDSVTLRSSSGIDFHLRQLLSDHLGPNQKAVIASTYRAIKEQMTNEHLRSVNDDMAELKGALDDEVISLAMDQSPRTSWEASVTPHIDDVPFAMAGQGQQATVKIILAMTRSVGASRIVIVEEPENHLSHTSLNKLIFRISELAGTDQQLFVTTHSSFVLNRLGLSALLFLADGSISKMSDISTDTAAYFKKLPGYNTLRIVLASRVVLVEGPSDEIIFERFYKDKYGRRPIEDGIDIISMGGLALKRGFELCKSLSKPCIAVRDNDGKTLAEIEGELGNLIETGSREVFVGELESGTTLEPQIIDCNDAAHLREILHVSSLVSIESWMKNNKTEAAIRIAEAERNLVVPSYLEKAIVFFHA